MSDIIRVLRVVEYEGPREWVEKTLVNSIHGEKIISKSDGSPTLIIRASTLGTVATILARVPDALTGPIIHEGR